MADKTRNKSRSASLSQASSDSALSGTAGMAAASAANKSAGSSPSETEAALSLILKRLGALEEVKESIAQMTSDMKLMQLANEEYRRKHEEDIAKLTELLTESRRLHQADKREHLITKQALRASQQQNRRIEVQLNDIANRQRICNIRLDGKDEEQNENLRGHILEMAEAMGVANMKAHDIQAIYRLGKLKPTRAGVRQMPRTIMITFVNEKVRNNFYYARANLKHLQDYRGTFLNDDVTAMTRRQRDDYRAVAALARSDGREVRVHTDGLVIDNHKYLLTDPLSLPAKYGLEKAKTIEEGGEIYFASESSCLSNFAPAPIVEGDTVFATSEHYYQAAKCSHLNEPEKRAQIISAPTPLEAKKIADTVTETPEWRDMRMGVMERAICLKFDQNPTLATKLLATGDLRLNEATHNDFFGIGMTLLAKGIKEKSYRGANKLGEILANKRAGLRLAVAGDGATGN